MAESDLILDKRHVLMSINNDIQTSKNDLRAISALSGDALSQFSKLFQN